MRKQSGFTLVELMITVALVAIITAFALPNFLSWLPNYRLRSATHDLFSNFQKAKLEAVKRNINTMVCFSGTDYTVFVDSLPLNAPNFQYDATPSPGEDVVAQVNWSDYKGISASLASINFPTVGANKCFTFRPNGIPVDVTYTAIGGNAQVSNTSGKTTTVFVSEAGSIRIE